MFPSNQFMILYTKLIVWWIAISAHMINRKMMNRFFGRFNLAFSIHIQSKIFVHIAEFNQTEVQSIFVVVVVLILSKPKVVCICIPDLFEHQTFNKQLGESLNIWTECYLKMAIEFVFSILNEFCLFIPNTYSDVVGDFHSFFSVFLLFKYGMHLMVSWCVWHFIDQIYMVFVWVYNIHYIYVHSSFVTVNQHEIVNEKCMCFIFQLASWFSTVWIICFNSQRYTNELKCN